MTADLTRAEIEAMAADIHASHPWHKALTQLLRQLDAAEAMLTGPLSHAAIVAQKDRKIIAANARADAAAGQMRERCAAAISLCGDSAVTEAMGQELCCSGHHCGCRGATFWV